MPENPYDQAARFTAKLDPYGFLAWVLGIPADRLGFSGWIDTRGIPFPGDPERTGDTVVRLDRAEGTDPPWAIAVEFQAEPDPLMFGRLLAYLSQIWIQLKPDSERGSRFQIGAAVVNMTGSGLASREMSLPETTLVTHLGVVERNLAHENADTTLGQIESGELSRGVLPWVPLMQGGEDVMMIDRWKRLAEAEPVRRRRSEYAGLAIVFATAAKRRKVWEAALEGWNVIECSVMDDWIAKGVEKGRSQGEVIGVAESLLKVLKARFGAVPDALATTIKTCGNSQTLQGWIESAVLAESLAAFQNAIEA